MTNVMVLVVAPGATRALVAVAVDRSTVRVELRLAPLAKARRVIDAEGEAVEALTRAVSA